MSEHYEAARDKYFISTDKQKLDLETVHNYLCRESYWAQNIPKALVEKSIENSLCFGLYDGDKQIGFARLITDKATFAYLADVFVLQDYRGKGLSKWLMQTIHAHPELQNLRRWSLATKDAHGLYEQFGWMHLTEHTASRLMLKLNPDVYKKVE